MSCSWLFLLLLFFASTHFHLYQSTYALDGSDGMQAATGFIVEQAACIRIPINKSRYAKSLSIAGSVFLNSKRNKHNSQTVFLLHPVNLTDYDLVAIFDVRMVSFSPVYGKNDSSTERR